MNSLIAAHQSPCDGAMSDRGSGIGETLPLRLMINKEQRRFRSAFWNRIRQNSDDSRSIAELWRLQLHRWTTVFVRQYSAMALRGRKTDMGSPQR